MRAHIVGGGFGGLAAAVCLIRNAGVPGQDITIYEAEERAGGGFFLAGNAGTGYHLLGSVFDEEFPCTFGLLQTIPSAGDPSVSIKDSLFSFNKRHPFQDRAHIIDRNGQKMHGPRFGLTLGDAFCFLRLVLTPEAALYGKRIDEFFSPRFFSTEFWLCWASIMGTLPQHSAVEFRRYINCTLVLFPHLSDMTNVMRTPVNQYEFFIEPMVAWLRAAGVTLRTGAFVRDIGLAPSDSRITVNRIDYELNNAATSVAVAPDDLVLVTTGSQVADISVGSMTEAPRPRRSGRSWALWQRLAQQRRGFGNPERFFGEAQVPLSHWVTFTVTTIGTEFADQLKALTGSETGSGGLVTLKNSAWRLSITLFHQPEVIGQPSGTYVWWGYGLYPDPNGDFVQKPMGACTGSEILEEVLRQLRFDAQFDKIMASSKCVPCYMPYINNIWALRSRTDRPSPVPDGATKFELIGQYVEVPRDIAFIIEYSARTAWQAVHTLLKRGPAPPPVYQGQTDPKALWGALKVLLFSGDE